EDVLLKVNEALTKNRIASVVIPEIASMVDVTNLKGNTEHLVTVNVQIKLIDSESGESVDFFGISSGQDAGDKAVMKA
ncbi:single-stranded DNA-binding protein, partial [Fusobacterium mortiferum]|nr:single-stranded DNA-binding protein [Fusobacterium mortiferum]